MTNVNKLALAAAAAAALGSAVASNAYAGSNINGPKLTGIVIESLEAYRPVITAVGLPSAETVELRQQQAAPAGETVRPHEQATR